MSNLSQNDRERIVDNLRTRLISVDEANVRMVLDGRFRLITNTVPRSVRKALNDAVKAKVLGRFKKEGQKPEAYFHPNFDYLAVSARNKHAEKINSALTSVLTRVGE